MLAKFFWDDGSGIVVADWFEGSTLHVCVNGHHFKSDGEHWKYISPCDRQKCARAMKQRAFIFEKKEEIDAIINI